MTVSLVTGATSGIGRAAATALARAGHHVLVHGRSPGLVDEVVAEVRQVGRADGIVADLADPTAIATVPAQVAALAPTVDRLIHNAGLCLATRTLTVDGLETTFAVNHLAVFRLTAHLLPFLPAGGRVIVTASRNHAEGRFVADDLQRSRRRWSGYLAYSDSKLLNLLFVHQAARRLASRGLVVHAVHPGTVATGWGQDELTCLGLLMQVARPLRVLSTPEAGARTTVFLATDPLPGTCTGGYWTRCRQVKPRRHALDEAAAEALWRASQELSPGLPAWG